MNHSIIPPSSAFIWGSPDGCTGWPLMSQQYPQTEESEDSKIGTASHEIGATLIDNMSRGIYSNTFSDFDNKQATNGVLFDEEMFDGAKIYADDVAVVMRKNAIFGGPHFGIEQRIECPSIHELSFGTPDMWIYNHFNYHLWIWDYKFGHRIVEVFENWQMINYLAGLMDKLNINGLVDRRIIIHIRVIQPRAFHRDGIIREWTIKASKLRGYFNTLNSKAHESLGSESIIRSGPHCRDCSARHACPSALESGLNLYEVAKQPISIELSPDALGVQLSIVRRAIKQLEYIDSGLTEQAEGLIRNGKLLTGWSLKSGQGREIWSKSDSEIIALGKLLGHDLKKSDKPITPKQARDKGIDDSMIKQFSETKRTALTLTPDDGSKTKRLFS